jgi:signal transduction histidine kinase
LFAALYGGLWPALLATVLSAVASAFFFLPPTHSLNIGPDDAMRLFVFAAVGVVVSSVAAARRRAELRLGEAWAAEERANHAKDRLFAIVSHELRTPLSPVLATADLIEGDAELPEWVREDARMVRRNVELQLRVIEDLLEFNRIEHGKLALRQEPVDLNGVLRDSVRMCEAAAETKGVRLVTDLAPSGGTLSGDATRLCQLFANLIRNGVKFTPAGGLVTVSSTDTTAGTARVQVKDTGVGIPPEVLPAVFNAFEQGGDSTTRRYGGLGLGLAIAKGIVEAHAGSIAAHSDGAGQGATFTVELPLRPLAERMLEKQGGQRSSSRVLGLV